MEWCANPSVSKNKRAWILLLESATHSANTYFELSAFLSVGVEPLSGVLLKLWVFRLGIPLIVFLSSDVGNADGFCLSEPVPSWLSFEGLMPSDNGDVELVSVFEVPEVVEVEVAAVTDEGVDDDEPAVACAEGDLISERAPLEPLGVV